MRDVLTDEQWARLEPHLPPQKPPTGRPNKDHRPVLEAILWVLRTGAPWRDLPERFGPWGTVYSRFYRWTRRGAEAAGMMRAAVATSSSPRADAGRLSKTASQPGSALVDVARPSLPQVECNRRA